VDNNRLTTIDVGLFNELGSLAELRMRENPITNISVGGFSGLHSLTNL
jgi:hypothetical protein